MAGRIRQEDVDAVREKTDIIQVISGYLQLKKAGGDSYKGLCPFHMEKSPSLSVSPSKQVYYCFGCGEAGNVFRFLQKMEDLSFAEVVERLARDVGIALRYEGQTASSLRAEGRRQVLHRVLSEAGRLYNRMLLEGREGAEARAYVDSRGISTESVERFGIGYAPGYPDFLLKRLTKSYTPELLVEAGLVARDDQGNMRDRFRGRVMFPVHDLSGNTVGFGGRLLAGPHAPSNAAKYVNSADSPIYHKGSLLYNLNRAKAEITRTSRAFVVEGYTDVIALDQAGVRTGVATCGTALGEDHIRLLSRFTERIVLAFDSDDAGARAAERAYQFHQAYQADISVLVLPSGQDPADFVLALRAEGRDPGEVFGGLADGAVPLVEYMIGRSLLGRDLSTPEERSRAVRAGLELVLPLEDPVRQLDYARILAGKVGESETAVMLQLQRMAGRPAGDHGTPEPARPPRGRVAPDEEVESEVLKLMVQAPELCAAQIAALAPDRFAKSSHRAVFELIRDNGNGGGPISISSLVALAQEQPRGDQLGRLIAILAVEPPKSAGMPVREYAEHVFLRLEEFALKRQVDAVRKELERLNPLKAPEEHAALFERLVALEGERRRLRSQNQ